MIKKPIKLTIITEDEPFYIAEAFNYFLSQLPEEYNVNFVMVMKYFHTSNPALNKIKAKDIKRIFGTSVLLRFLWRLLLGRLKKSKRVTSVFRKHNIPVCSGIIDINSEEILHSIKHHAPDLLIAVGVNTLFQKPLRELARIGCINVHTGIKPEHKGRGSIFWALADGHDETGITVHFIDEHIDSGHIITKSQYSIAERSFDKVLRDLRFLSMNTLLDALTIIKNQKTPRPVCTYLAEIKPRALPEVEDLKMFVARGNKIF